MQYFSSHERIFSVISWGSSILKPFMKISVGGIREIGEDVDEKEKETWATDRPCA